MEDFLVSNNEEHPNVTEKTCLNDILSNLIQSFDGKKVQTFNNQPFNSNDPFSLENHYLDNHVKNEWRPAFRAAFKKIYSDQHFLCFSWKTLNINQINY